jgi:SAM-dependent methyltransferase
MAGPAGACPACGSTLVRAASPAKGYWLLRCDTCGLGRIDPLPDVTALAAYYSSVYSLAADTDRVDLGSYERQAAGMARLFARLAPRAATICEVGCSGGWALKALQRRGYAVKGYELSATTSRLARERLGLDVVTGEFSGEGESFDVIVMRHVLEHTVNPVSQLAAAAARLNPGGLIFLVVPNGGSLSSRLLGQYWSWYIPPAHIWYFSGASLTRLVEAAGLAVRETGSRQGDANSPPVELATGVVRWMRQARRPAGAGSAPAAPERLRTYGPLSRVVRAANVMLAPVSAAVGAVGLGDELWLAAIRT